MTTATNETGAERMKRLLIVLMLISPFSFADWGDVYYCQMTTFSTETLEGKKTDVYLQKFQFKLDETKKSMVFGGSGYFESTAIVLKQGSYWPKRETWYAKDRYSLTYFDNGKFMHVSTGSTGSKSISADCDKLE